MKKWILLFLVLTLLLSIPLSASAAPDKIVDDADLLTDSEEAALEEKAQALADKYQIDVVIVTVWSLDGKTSEAYADDYFDYNGYGIGDEHSGVLLLLAMEYRDWAISTCGEAIYALTDYGNQALFSEISGYLKWDEYYDAFDTYLEALEPYFAAYADGAPIDGFPDEYTGPGTYEPGSGEEHVYYPEQKSVWDVLPGALLKALAAGAVVGGIALLIMQGMMRTSKPQNGAVSYMQPGTYNLDQIQDVFLYSNVSKVRRSEPSSSSGGHSSSSHSGGGSSVHHSSSGSSHGGSHGKF